MLAKKRLLGEYKIGRTIGEGAFSKVRLAAHRETGEKVAIKIIKKQAESQERLNNDSTKVSSSDAKLFLSSLSKEVKLLMRLEHPNIIKLHQVIDTEAELFIIMEYASEGELIDYIAAKGFLSERECRKFFRQLISALDHCHQAGVIHRDLKLENLLLSSEKNLLLSDFGLGRSIQNTNQILSTFCGTPLYASPELVSGIKYVGPSADIWSMGIVLYIMASGKPPFRCDSIAELYSQIKAVKYHCPESFSEDLKMVLKKILVRDPQKRATMDDLRADEWVNKGENEPPLRVVPRISVSNVSEENINALVSGIQHFEGFTVYNFNTPGKLAVRFDESTPSQQIQTAPEPSPVNSPVSLMIENIPYSATTKSDSNPDDLNNLSANHSRRSSIASILSRFNPFSKRESVSSQSSGTQKQEEFRQRSKSFANGPISSKKEENIKIVKQPSNTRVPVPSVSTAPAIPVPIAHRRRHSMSVENNSSVFSGFQTITSGARNTQKVSDVQPKLQDNAHQAASLGSVAVAGSLEIPTSNHINSQNILNTAGGSSSINFGSGGAVNVPITNRISRSSTGPTQPVPQNMISQNRIRPVPSGSIRQVGPSMDQIKENEDEVAGHSSVHTSNVASSGQQLAVNQIPLKSHRRSIILNQQQQSLEVKTNSLRPPSTLDATGNGHDRRYSIFSDPLYSSATGVTNGSCPIYGDAIRSVRYNFGLITANREAQEMAAHLERLLQNQMLFPPHLYGDTGIRFEQRGKWVYVCYYEQPIGGKVIFEAEICKVWLLKMNAVRLKRLGGDAFSYKATFEKLATALKD